MAFLDSLINEVAGKFGLGDKAGPLLSETLSLMTNESSGGLAGFINRFKQAGLGDLVSSWISTGANRPITENQIEGVLGQDLIGNMASRTGLNSSIATSALAFVIPKIIDYLTPNGTIPTAIPSAVTSFLSGHGERDYERAAAGAASTGSSLSKLWPLLLIPILAFAGYRYCNRAPETATDQPVTVSPTVVVPTINSKLTLVNDAGKIKVSGVVPDEKTRTEILNQLRAAFGEGNYIGDIKVDVNARPVTWLEKLKDALAAFKVPGAELIFDGDAIKVGGDIAADLKSGLLDKLKAIFGAGFTLTALNLDINAAVREAAEKTKAALAALTPTSTGEDLAKALNLNIINFASGSAAIPKDNQEVLIKAADAIKAAPAGIKLEVGGHTDNVGNSADNVLLSQKRAEAVKAFLVKNGVNADMLNTKGYGDSNPVASNDTSDGRFQNRRIAYTLVK